MKDFSFINVLIVAGIIIISVIISFILLSINEDNLCNQWAKDDLTDYSLEAFYPEEYHPDRLSLGITSNQTVEFFAIICVKEGRRIQQPRDKTVFAK